MNSLLYALACITVPMAWSLLVTMAFRRAEKRTSDVESASDLDLHERS